MSIFSVRDQTVFGCQNVPTRRAWKQFSRRQIFAGSFSMHTGCYVGNRVRAARFDAELCGHWWFEGPSLLEQFIRQVANERDFRLTTPSEYLAAHPTQQIVEPAASTWGENGHLAVWLDPSNAWIYPHLHIAAQRMSEAARRHAENCSPQADRLLKQLARELLLAQSSDWAFLIKTGTAREYATNRTIDHLARFNRLFDQLVTNGIDEEFLRDCEWRDNLFPNLNWRYYI